MDAVISILQDAWRIVVAIVVAIVGAGLAVYYMPPIRHVVDTWIKGRVAHHFDAQLETHRHERTLRDSTPAGS